MELTADRLPTEEEVRAFALDDRWYVIGTDGDRVVTRWSRGAWLLWGWEGGEALGRVTTDLINLTGTKQGQARLQEIRQEVAANGSGRLESNDVWYGKDGHPVMIEEGFVWFCRGVGTLTIGRGRSLEPEGLLEENRRLRTLLTRQMRPTDALELESGVNERLEGFVTMRWGDMSGQLTVEEAGVHARRMYQLAHLARTDANVMRALYELGMGETASDVLSAIRRWNDNEEGEE
jgi:hypothetical protein